MTTESTHNLIPCATCPWRVEKDSTTIPRYVHSKAINLLKTVGGGDDFRRIMACHHSEEGDSEAETVCKGYLAQVGWSNLNVRLLVVQDKLPSPTEAQGACLEAGLELEPDYETVLTKLATSCAR